jgi:hypothetical protein
MSAAAQAAKDAKDKSKNGEKECTGAGGHGQSPQSPVGVVRDRARTPGSSHSSPDRHNTPGSHHKSGRKVSAQVISDVVARLTPARADPAAVQSPTVLSRSLQKTAPAPAPAPAQTPAPAPAPAEPFPRSILKKTSPMKVLIIVFLLLEVQQARHTAYAFTSPHLYTQ